MKINKAQKFREWKEFLKDDEDFDWYYIIRVIRYKLERTRKCILTNNIILDAGKIGKQIKQVEDLLRRVEQNSYFREELKELEQKYGKRNLKMKTKALKDKGFSEIQFSSSWDKLPPSERGAAKRTLKAAFRRAHRDQIKDLQKAFDLMAKNIMGWWD